MNRFGAGFGLGMGGGAQSQRRPYGVRFRDDTSKYVYERTGLLSGYAANVAAPENMLTVQKLMKRCVVKSDGTVNYYLHPTNSMWKAGSIPSGAIEVTAVSAPHSEANAEVTISSLHKVTADNVGKVIELYDVDETRKWHAMIIDVDLIGNKYLCANPLTIGWGMNASEALCTVARIGNAILNGADGQVMVEIPGFWHRHNWETDADGTWQRHEISLHQFPGAHYFAKRYISAFEGCVAANDIAVDGWTGTWDSENNVWASINYAAQGTKFLSAAGAYPATYISRSESRTRSAAIGAPFYQYGYEDNLVIQILMITEFATLNMQSGALNIGAGISSFTDNAINWSTYNGTRPIRRTGDTIRSGNATWDMSTLAKLAIMQANGPAFYTIQSISYRGIENPYGHIWKWVDGINLQWEPTANNKAFMTPYITTDPALFMDTIDAAHIALPDKMVSHHYEGGAWVNKNRYWKDPSPQLLPTEVSASSTSYIGDYSYYPTKPGTPGNLQVLAVGGYAFLGASVGAFCVSSTNGSGFRTARIGGRLCSKIIE